MLPLCVSTIEGLSPKWSIGRINIVTENLFKASRKNVAFPGVQLIGVGLIAIKGEQNNREEARREKAKECV